MQKLSSTSGGVSSLPPNLYIDSVLNVLGSQTDIPDRQDREQNLSIAPTANIPDVELHLKCNRCDTVGSIMMQNCYHCKQILCAICWQTHMDELDKQVRQLDVQLNSASEKMDHKIIAYKNRFNDISQQIKEYFNEQITTLRNNERSLLDESQRILNDGLCAHELVMEKIRRLKTTVADSTIGPNGDLVQRFLNLHKEISLVFEEISHWGKEIILFDQKNIKLEILSAFDNNGPVRATDKNQEALKHKSLITIQLDSYEDVLSFYRKHSFRPKLYWNKCHRPAGVGIAPWSLDSISHPLIYIAGAESKIIFIINKTNGEIIQRICYDQMVYPNGITFDSNRKELFVTDKWKHCIFVFSANGTFLRQLCDKGDQEGFLRSPEGLAVGPNGSLFVCDAGNDRIQCINSTTGRMLSQFGRIPKDQLLNATQTKIPTRDVDLKSPMGIAIYKETIFVLDTGNRRVKAFNKRGEKVMEFGQTGSLAGQFQHPEVIAVDTNGFLLVGDGGNARIQVYRPDGQFVNVIGARGESPGKFNWLSGLFVSRDREIIISDYKNHTVQVIA
ncbi:uncharacterized protein LOC131435285 isoform X2 [Malaya genurostris]|nr:uncharacterized protein LOC131435285 isoform X2 [Malaya genurostris]